MSQENIEHLDFSPTDPVTQGGLEWMAKQGPVPEVSQTEGYQHPEPKAEAMPASEDRVDSDELEEADDHTIQLEKAVDEKLKGLYEHIAEVTEWDEDMAKTFMRGAFEAGYFLRDKDNRSFGQQYMVRKQPDD
jgi:hypothetical protein